MSANITIKAIHHADEYSSSVLFGQISSTPNRFCSNIQFVIYALICHEYCPRNLDPFYSLTYYIKLVKTSWTDSIYTYDEKEEGTLFMLFFVLGESMRVNRIKLKPSIKKVSI